MMSFYSAVGSYQIRREEGIKMPFIQKLGKLYPLSIPEFCIWSTLLWEVMTHDELEAEYSAQMNSAGMKAPKLDDMLALLLKRRLIITGMGYTGSDALYNMLSDAFVIPFRLSKGRQILSILRCWAKNLIRLPDAFHKLRVNSSMNEDEARVVALVEQTPLSTAELVCCFEKGITDVSTSEKVIAGIYPDDDSDQTHISNEEFSSAMRLSVLRAVSNLYLRHQIILEVP